ncbi:MAG: hypothetical protein LBL58_17655 [Tannerellaceae bacterium]|jgi:hypothetical protein|nr:hypothetical protein [Tannerellaceae bacterium]
MKNILFVTGIFITFLFFHTPDEELADDTFALNKCEAVVLEKNATKDIQHRFEIISNDLKNSNCRTPRRNVQKTNLLPNNNKVLKNIIRILQDFQLKEKELLQKVSEYVAKRQTLYLASLLSRRGYHVYALRKITI